MTPDAEWDNCEIRLASGDQLVLFTDGLFENTDADGAEFGMDRVIEIAARHHCDPIEQTVAALEEALSGFCKDEPPRDDVTIVGLRID